MKIKGKKVVDAKEPVLLIISAADVTKGKTKNPGGCAAALSAMRTCKGAVSAKVHLSRAYVEYPDKIVRYMTPQRLRTEIVSFDRGHKFESGDYELQVPPKAVRLGLDHGGNYPRKRNRENEKPRRSFHFTQGVRAHAPKPSDWK